MHLFLQSELTEQQAQTNAHITNLAQTLTSFVNIKNLNANTVGVSTALEETGEPHNQASQMETDGASVQQPEYLSSTLAAAGVSSPATQLNLQQAQIGEQTSQPEAESRSVPLTLGPVPHIPLQFGGVPLGSKVKGQMHHQNDLGSK